VPIEADASALQKLREARPDFCFNIAEGFGGPWRESWIPAILEELRVPYLGSDPLTLGICLHKARAKEVLLAHALPTPPFVVLEEPARRAPPFGFPAVVKPLHEGSSKGVRNDSLVRGPAELERQVARVLTDYGQPALVEKFLPGRELTVGLLGNGRTLEVLPIVGLNFAGLPAGANPIYGYEAKWVWDTPERPVELFECPARLSPELAFETAELCKEAFRVLGCRDWCRMDVRLDERERPAILEVNPLPGILPRPEEHSCLPTAARAAGMDFAALVHRLMRIGLDRCGLPAPREAVSPARA
jgi:D-alanine-D-alanine ligase